LGTPGVVFDTLLRARFFSAIGQNARPARLENFKSFDAASSINLSVK
jgi:hypothetical protein